MVIDGRAIAATVLARARERASTLPHPPRIAAIVANETPATRSYLSIKEKRAEDAGCVLAIERLPESSDTAALRAAVERSVADAIIVQLPLSSAVDARMVCDAITSAQDADVLSAAARSAFMRGDEQALLPPVVGALVEILSRAGVEAEGKKAVVVGSGYLVGMPAAAWLAQQGAQVVSVNQKSGDLAAALKDADLVVLGAGSPHLVTPGMLKKGVVLIDAGTSESGGVTVGDADPACAATCSVFTPVPGGVGPIAVAKLFENAVILAERNLSF
jgi:methylenetetrahydrofolate dehydrogenase (NADP+) / methenyltetrahydrofolate cyclohydrolase